MAQNWKKSQQAQCRQFSSPTTFSNAMPTDACFMSHAVRPKLLKYGIYAEIRKVKLIK